MLLPIDVARIPTYLPLSSGSVRTGFFVQQHFLLIQPDQSAVLKTVEIWLIHIWSILIKDLLFGRFIIKVSILGRPDPWWMINSFSVNPGSQEWLLHSLLGKGGNSRRLLSGRLFWSFNDDTLSTERLYCTVLYQLLSRQRYISGRAVAFAAGAVNRKETNPSARPEFSCLFLIRNATW